MQEEERMRPEDETRRGRTPTSTSESGAREAANAESASQHDEARHTVSRATVPSRRSRADTRDSSRRSSVPCTSTSDTRRTPGWRVSRALLLFSGLVVWAARALHLSQDRS